MQLLSQGTLRLVLGENQSAKPAAIGDLLAALMRVDLARPAMAWVYPRWLASPSWALATPSRGGGHKKHLYT